MIAIFKKELKSYFMSMIGYIIIAMFVGLTGLLFFLTNLSNQIANYEYVISSFLIFLLFFVPILTMRSFSEEYRQKTDQLLLTSCTNTYEIVLGKFFAMLYLIIVAIIITLIFPILLMFFGKLNVSAIINSYIGLILFTSSFLAVGIFISTFTDNQIISGIITFIFMVIVLIIEDSIKIFPSDKIWSLTLIIFLILIFGLYLNSNNKNIYFSLSITLVLLLVVISLFFIKSSIFEGAILKIGTSISNFSRFENFKNNILSLADIVYYLSFTSFFLLLSVNTIEKRKWN